MGEPADQSNVNGADAKGPSYTINIGGTDYPWSGPTITAPQVREVAGWDAGQAVYEEDLKSGTKILLSDDDIVELKPGRGFAKQVEFVSATVVPPRSHAK